MNLRTFGLAASLALLVASALLLSGGIASAHERRNIQGFTFVVGFLTEPALLNQPNSIDLRISRTADASPVTGAEKTLKAEITMDGKTLAMDLTPRFGTPGGYNGAFTPTKAGAYTFRFTGTIDGGPPIDEKFTSSPTTFGAVATPVAFPDPLPVIQDVAKSQAQLDEQLIALDGKDDSAGSDSAMMVGTLGVVLGAVGIGIGTLSLTKKSSG